MNHKIMLKYIELYFIAVLKNNRLNNSILLADGINIYNKELASWQISKNKSVIMSDFCAIQNFLKALCAYSLITNDNKYYEEAKRITKYFLDNFVDKNGLFIWGAHNFIDLKTLTSSGPIDKSNVHELKNAFPFYDLFYEVDKNKTIKFLNQIWTAHINDWDTLDLNRHGAYEKEYNPIISTKFVNKFDVVDQTILPDLKEAKGLTFLNICSDLIYASFYLSKYTNNDLPLRWGEYLARQFMLAQNKQTKLPVYQYTKPLKVLDTKDDNETFSCYGDRVQRQMKEFGKIALEGNRLFDPHSTIGTPLNLALNLAIDFNNKNIGDWSSFRIKNYFDYSYDLESNNFKPMFNDGIDLTGYILLRNGYLGKKGKVLKRVEFSGEIAVSLLSAYFYSLDIEIYNYLRHAIIKSGFGDIGDLNHDNINLNYDITDIDEQWLNLFIEIYNYTKKEEYGNYIEKLIELVFKNKYRKNYFITDKDNLYSKINNPYPLLILRYIGIKNNISNLPPYYSTSGFIQGEYYKDGEIINVKDRDLIYNLKK